MRKIMFLAAMAAAACAQTPDYGRSAQTGAVYDLGNASRTIVVRKGTGAPAGACTAGELYQRTDTSDGKLLYGCPAGSWVLVGDGAGAASGGDSIFDHTALSLAAACSVGTNTSGQICGVLSGGAVSSGTVAVGASAGSNANETGFAQLSSSTTNAESGYMVWLGGNILANGTFSWPALFSASATWQVDVLLRLNTDAARNTRRVRVGFVANPGSNFVAPGSLMSGLWLRHDTAAAFDDGGNWYAQACSSAGATAEKCDSGASPEVLVASTTVSDTQYQLLRIRWDGAKVYFSVNGGAEKTICASGVAGCNVNFSWAYPTTWPVQLVVSAGTHAASSQHTYALRKVAFRLAGLTSY